MKPKLPFGLIAAALASSAQFDGTSHYTPEEEASNREPKPERGLCPWCGVMVDNPEAVEKPVDYCHHAWTRYNLAFVAVAGFGLACPVWGLNRAWIMPPGKSPFGSGSFGNPNGKMFVQGNAPTLNWTGSSALAAMFDVGQKVACVNATWGPGVHDYFNVLPVKGGVYTVRDIVPGQDWGLNATCAVLLVECENRPNQHGIEPGFHVTRFRELTPEEEREQAVATIEMPAEFFPDGMHHVNCRCTMYYCNDELLRRLIDETTAQPWTPPKDSANVQGLSMMKQPNVASDLQGDSGRFGANGGTSEGIPATSGSVLNG